MNSAEVDVAAATPTCQICGRSWGRDDDPEDWLGVEVDFSGGRLYAAFCSREHAQEWFAKPLPEPPPRVPPAPLDTGERALIFGVGTLAVLAAAVFVIGAITIVRAALGWLG
ncbi:hypothetical protein ACIB24_02995 [Spongisporangium articulatum]|uniref:Uncharacterized protein n=1 Tax=Spongisporangium articulatum TaxID=3362603 RepID=A0ABW8AJ44_9ACTN